MPTIRFVYREKSLLGNPVNGHKKRIELLVDEIKKQYPTMINIKLGFPKAGESFGDIVVSDSISLDLPAKSKYVFIDCGNATYHNKSNHHIDLYINPNLGATNVPEDNIKTALVGNDFNILNKHVFDYVLPFHEIDVMFNPGGNRDKFWDQIGELNTSLSYSFSKDSNELQGDFLARMRKARVIITTPSVTMLEAMAMGKPVFLVKTSEDQGLNMEYALNFKIAKQFESMKQVETLFNNGGLIELREKARKYMSSAKNGTERVAGAILELL